MLLAEHLAKVAASQKPSIIQEYPKWVRFEGKEQIAASRAEEEALLKSWGAASSHSSEPQDAPSGSSPGGGTPIAPAVNKLAGSDESGPEPEKRGPGRPRNPIKE